MHINQFITYLLDLDRFLFNSGKKINVFDLSEIR